MKTTATLVVYLVIFAFFICLGIAEIFIATH